MRLLVLFSGAGGAAVGYHRAGFWEIVGVDSAPQPRYPFEFFQADALEYLAAHGREFDAVHASPPCQFYSEATPEDYRASHPDLIVPVRDALRELGRPYVIENVAGARALLVNPLMLCGSALGLPIERHRFFEIWPEQFELTPPCAHHYGATWAMIGGQSRRVEIPVLCSGGGDGQRAKRKNHRPRSTVAEIGWAMGIDWMLQRELTEAIPPAYTEFIGTILLRAMREDL